ncbi:MAG TPA: hypothetical protein VGF56_16380 [Rhizomicrobium sp.]|jgi:hypothetical protein
MVLFWRGWGLGVFLLFVFWMFALIGFAVVAQPYQPDRTKAGLDVQWLFALLFLLHAASIAALALYRRRTGARRDADEFMFLRLAVWPWILLVPAALLAGASALGYPLFGR